MEGKPRSIRSTILAKLAMLSSIGAMSSMLKGVSAQVWVASAHSLLLVHTSSRSSICRQANELLQPLC